MSIDFFQLQSQALRLPREQRAELVRALLDTLEDVDSGVRDAWMQETLERLHAFDSGEVQPIAAATVFERARGMVR
jgi:putative addiction module component (TIGR02574 family)